MAELLKNVYNRQFFDQFIKATQQVVPEFKKDSFLNQIFDNHWEDKELKERMRHTSIVLRNHLAKDFNENAPTLLKVINQLMENGYKKDSLELMFFPDFIELYGLDNYDLSINAFEQITQITSCEFGVRPFIIKYQAKMLEQMLLWSKHKHPMVRRLSSEGSRPRLPWAMAIPALKENPAPLVPILENLKNDESESVRRSVANNLNDISKDHPNTVISLSKKWFGETKETDWIIKHASRTLLKQGYPEMMRLFGFGSFKSVKVNNFKILTPNVIVGDSLEFTFQLENTGNSMLKIRLEYGLYYQKANGSLSKKVFKISEKEYPENSITTINRKQSFKVITTRKFHLGKHQVSLIINGKEFNKLDFNLKE